MLKLSAGIQWHFPQWTKPQNEIPQTALQWFQLQGSHLVVNALPNISPSSKEIKPEGGEGRIAITGRQSLLCFACQERKQALGASLPPDEDFGNT